MPETAPSVAKSRPLSVLEAASQLLRRWYVVVLVGLVGAGGAYMLKDRLSVSFQSKATIRVTQNLPMPPLASDIQLPKEDPLDPENLALTLIQEAVTTEKLEQLFAASKATFVEQTAGDRQRQKFITWARKHAKLTPVSTTRYVVKAWGKTPVQARELVAHICASAIKSYKQIMMGRVDNLSTFLGKQEKQAQQKLTTHEKTMITFLRDNPSLVVQALSRDRRLSATGPDRMRVASTRRVLSQATLGLGQGDSELKRLMDLRAQLRSELSSMDYNDDGESAGSAGAAKLKELQKARGRLEALSARGLSDSHPDVKRARRKVQRLEVEARQVKPGQTSGATSHQIKIKQKLKLVERKLRARVKKTKTSPRVEAKWQQMLRQQQMLLRQHESLNKLQTEASLRSRMGAKEAKRLAYIVEEPTTPVKPKGVKPKVLLAAGVAFSLLLGTILALLLGVLDKKVYSHKEVVSLLGMPLLARLHKQSAKQALRGSREEDSSSAEMLGWSRKDDVVEVGMRMRPLPQEPEDMRDEDPYMEQQQDMNWPALPAHEPSSEHALAIMDQQGGAMVVGGGAEVEEETVTLKIHSVVASAPATAGVFLATAPDSAGADQQRLAANRLLETPGFLGCKVIVVCSWAPKVGRTTVTANLALAFAESRRRTLLIDTCNGNPACTRLFGLRPDDDTLLQSQLTAHLDGATESWAMYKVAEALNVIPAGTQERPMASLLQSVAFATLMEQLRRIFDVIIIDSAALSGVSDAVVLQQHADAVVMVSRRKKTTLPGVTKALKQLEVDRVAGVVFNSY